MTSFILVPSNLSRPSMPLLPDHHGRCCSILETYAAGPRGMCDSPHNYLAAVVVYAPGRLLTVVIVVVAVPMTTLYHVLPVVPWHPIQHHE